MQSYDEVTNKYNKFLTGAQKKQLRQRANALSLQNAATRNQLQSAAVQQTNRSNEMLSSYGIAANLRTAPSSGPDELSRRQPQFRQQLQGLAAQEQGLLNQTGLQMANATIQAQIDAARRARGGTSYRVIDPETGEYLTDTKTGQVKTYSSKEDAQKVQTYLNTASMEQAPRAVVSHQSASQRNAGLIAALQREQQNLNAANAIAGNAFAGNAANIIGAGTAKTAESAVAEAGSDQRTRTVTVQKIGGVGADNIAKTIKGLFGGAVKAQGISRNDVQANDGKAIRQQNRDRENMTKVISYCRDAGIISAPSAARMMNDVTKGTANYPVMADYLTEQVTLNYCKGVETKAGQLFEAVNADIAGGYNSAAAQNVLTAYAKAQESGLTEDYAAVGQAYIDYVNDATDARIQAANGILLDYVHEGMPMQDAYRAQQAFKAGDIDGFTAVLEEYTERNQRGIVLTSVNRMEAAGAISKAEADTIREMAKNGDVAGAVQALADGSGQYYTEQLGNYGREAWKGVQESGRYKAPKDPDKLEEYWNENNEYWAAKWAYEIADKTNTAEAWKNFFDAYGKLAEAENSQSNLEARLNLDDAKRYGMSKEEWEKGWEAWRTGNTDEYISVLENATLVGGQVGYFQAATRDYQLKNGFGIDLATYHKYDSLTDEQIQEGIDALNKRVWSLETYDRREDRANIEEMEAILRVREADRNTAVYERYKDLSLEQLADAEKDVYGTMRSLFEKTNTYAWMNDADYWAYTQDPEGYLSKMGKAMAGIGYELEGADREAWNKVSTEWLMVNAAKTHQQSLKRAEDLKTMLETAKTEGGATYGASVLKIQRQGVEGIWGIHREKNWLGSEIWRDENGHKIGGDREDLLELYRALNMSTDEWGNAYADQTLGSAAQRDRAIAWRQFATDEQKEALNYYLATDLDKAAEFMKAMDTHVNEARMKDLQDRAAAQANEAPVLMHMVTYATKPLDAIGGVYTLAQTLAGNDVDPYSGWFDFNVFNGTVRQTHYDALKEATLKKLGSGAASASVFMLQTLDSMIDSWVSAKMGAALTGGAAGWTEAITLPVMGLSAAAETEREALIKGIPQEQAKKLALCAGVFEALFEVVSLENILHGAEDLTKSAWFRMGVGGLFEGSEETLTEAANMVAEAAIMCGQDSFNADTAALMKKGYKKETAMALTALGQVKQVGMAGLGGTLSGLGSGAINAVKANREIKKSGKNIRTNDRTEAVMTAAENSTDARVMELFNKVGEAYRNGSMIGDMDLGRINYALAMSDKVTALGAIDKAVEDGKVSNKEAKTAREAIETLYEASGRSLESTLYGFDAARLSEAFGGINENALTAISETMFEVTNDRTNRLNEKREERLTREAEARVDETLTGAEREAAVAEMRKTVQKEQDDLKKARIERARSGVTTMTKDSPVLNKPVKATEQYDGVEVRLHEIGSTAALTGREYAQLNFIRAMAKAGDVNIVVHDTLGMAGAIDADGVLHIGLDSQGVMSAMGHELTHYIERTVSEESWAKFKKFLMDAADRHEARGFEKLVEKKMREYADEMRGLSEQDARALAESEAFASLCEDVLKDEGRMRQLMQEDKSLFRKVYKWINGILDNLKDMIKGDRGGRDAAKVREDLEQIRDMWFELLNESRASGKSAEGAEQYMKTVKFNKADGSVTEYDDETRKTTVIREARKSTYQQDQERLLETAREIDEAKARTEQAQYDDEMAERTRATETTEDIDPNEAAYLGVTGENLYDEVNAQDRYLEEMEAQRWQAAYDDEIEYRTRPTATTDIIDEEHWKALGVTGENLYDEADAQSRYLDEMDAQREQAAYDDEMAERTRTTETTDYVDEGYWEALEREIGEAFIDEEAREANEAELERIRQESDGTDSIKADLKGMRERMQNGTVTEADLVTQRQLLEKAEHRVELAKRAYEKALTEENETARKRAERRLQKATEQRDRIQRGVQRMEMMYERGGRVSKPMADMLPKTSLDKAKAMTEEKPRQTTVIRDGVEQTIETKIPKAVEDIVTGVNKVSRWAWLDPIRMMDKLAGKNRELRETLTKVFENPFNEAAKRYTTALQQNRANYLNQMKECGVLFEGATDADKQKARAMSAAMQKYGEGVYYNELDERMNYGLEDLKREFPDDWQKIVRASELTREMYDEYIDRINEMLEEVYPNVIEHNETRRAKLEEYVKLATAREAHQYKEIGLIEQRLAHAEEQVKNNPNDREAQAILEYHQAQLENARKLAEKYATQADMRRVQMAEILDAVERGDDVRNRRLQRRADYFHHFNADNATGVEQLKRIWQSEDAEISPTLVGKTATTQPKSKWAGFMQHRSGEHTTYDAIGGMLKYMQAAERKLSFDPFIAHLTTMQKQLREAAHEGVNHDGVEITDANPMITWVEEWRNSIAGKSQNIDRFFTDKGVFGRKMVETFKWLNARARSNAVLMNFHSAAVQVSNIANAKTFVPNEKHWLSAARQLVDMTFGKSNQSDALRAAMESSAFLQQRYGLDFADIATENLEDTTAMKKLALKMLGMGDEFAGKYMWLAAYNQYIDGKNYDTGHTYRNAVEYADDITRRSSAGRGIGEQATMMNSSVINLLSPFQLEVNNTFQNFKDQAAKKNWKGLANMFVTTNLMNSVFQAAFGDRPLPFDLINAVFQAFKAGFADDDDESEEEKSFGQKVWQTAKGIGVNSLAEVVNAAPMAGLATGFAPDFFDEVLGDQSPTAFGSSNLGLGNLGDALINVKELASDFANGQWTSWDAFWTDFVQESDWMKIVLPWGGAQAQRSLKGIDALARGYSQKMSKDGELSVQFTIDRSNPFNWLKAPLLGKWVTKEGQAFLAGETKGMSAQDTAAMKESGLSASSFFDAMAQVKAAGKQKEVDEFGNTVVNGQTMQYRLMRDGTFDDATTMAMIGKMGGSALDKANAAVENGIPLKKWVTMMADFGEMQKDEDESKKDKFRSYIFADRDLDEKQREWLDRSVCGTTGERDYSSATWYELSKNATHYNMAKLAQADGISPEMALEWYGTASRKTVDAFGNEKGISNDEVRDLIFADERLSAEQKAAVEKMLFKTEKVRDYSSEALYRLSANETKYKRAQFAGTKGVDAAVAEKWLNFYDEKVPDAAGVDRASHNKDAVVMAIAEDRTLSKSQREAVYEMLYPNDKKRPDYTNKDWYYISTVSDAQYKKAQIAKAHGISEAVFAAEMREYYRMKDAKLGTGKNGAMKDRDTDAIIAKLGLSREDQKVLKGIIKNKITA